MTLKELRKQWPKWELGVYHYWNWHAWARPKRGWSRMGGPIDITHADKATAYHILNAAIGAHPKED